MITNIELTFIEKSWLEIILSKNFLGRDTIVHQINSAKIKREYTNYYILLKFQVNPKLEKIKDMVRVPVEMRLYKNDNVPIVFLLHVIQGYIYELEVFKADSSIINSNITFENSQIEILVNPEILS